LLEVVGTLEQIDVVGTLSVELSAESAIQFLVEVETNPFGKLEFDSPESFVEVD